MSEQPVYTLSVNKNTGELQVQPEQRRERTVINQELKRIIAQQKESKYLTLGLILSLLVAFVVIALFKEDLYFCVGLIVFAVVAILGYIVANYIDHLNIKYIMDTIRKIVHKPAQTEIIEKLLDDKHDPILEKNLLDKKKKNVYF